MKKDSDAMTTKESSKRETRMNKKTKILLIGVVLLVVMTGFTAAAIIMGGLTVKTGEKQMEQDLAAGITSDGIFAIIETEKGSITLEIFYKKTPLTACNFVGLAEGSLDAAKGKPFYDGLVFHRVIKEFMVQGGDPSGNGTGGPGYKFPDEIDSTLKHDVPGTLSMANSGPGTNGSQFFITHVPTPWLDGKHTVFGRVLTGQDVVNKIENNDVITKIKIVRRGAEAKDFAANQAAFNALLAGVADRSNAAQKDAQKATIDSITKKWPNAKKAESGVYYEILQPGSGESPKTGQSLTMKYRGYLLNGTVFDDSDMHKPLEFQVGRGQLIPGFDSQALQMKVGEKRTIIIPPELAYGPAGVPGVIPGNSFIAFDLELLSVK